MEIRDAVVGDAAEACAVLRRDTVSVWIGRPDASMLVAVESGAIVAVGMVTDAGEILLNYVSPVARFR